MKFLLSLSRLSAVLLGTILSLSGFAQTGNCPTNMLFLLHMDEQSGTVLHDYFGNHDANGPVAPVPATGIITGAMQFNDSNYERIPDNGNDFEFQGNASFTMEYWFKSGTQNAAQVGISRYEHSTGMTWWIGLNEFGGPLMEVKDNVNSNSYAAYIVDHNYCDNQWHYEVGVIDNAMHTVSIYVDGVLIKQVTNTNFPGNFIASTPVDISIGYMIRSSEGQPEYHMNGLIDEAAVFTRALTLEEIQAKYHNGNPSAYCTSVYAPVITSTPVTAASEDQVYTYNFTVTDQDVNDVLTLSAITKPSWLNFTWTPGQRSAVLSGTPTQSEVGSHSVVLRATDGYTTLNQSFTINVAAVNDPPVITGQNVLSINEDSYITLNKTDLQITDPDNQASDLTLHIGTGSHYQVNGNIITPDANYYGTLTVPVTVTDLASESNTFQLQITVNSVNDAPEFTTEPETSVHANDAYIYAFTVTDVDEQDVLTISVPTKPAWLNFVPGNKSGVLAGTPQAGDVGSAAVVIKVNDGHVDALQGYALVVLGPSGLDDHSADQILVFPNPVIDMIHLKSVKPVTLRFELYDMAGNLQRTLSLDGETTGEISVNGLNSGIYMYKVSQEGSVVTGKLTIK
jgi:hypothetical protein